MNDTQEQKNIIQHVQNNDGLTLVDAIAGAGKTYLLVQIAKVLNEMKKGSLNGLYLAYNKSIATEASRKFPKYVACKTTHSIAYQNTVKPFKLRLGTFSYKVITEKVSYDHKCEIIDNLKEFCLSRFTDFEKYAVEKQLTPLVKNIVAKYLEQMNEGTIECTHDFYLKLFHILLSNGDITFEPFDILLLDESGDLNEVTLEIFKLLPASKRIAVGDKHQNIYAFNHTINAFKLLEGEGTEFKLSQSFRVHSKIAARIEAFCKTYLDPDMHFKGVDYEDFTITTRGYIARTNSYLVDKMIELNSTKTPYKLVRKAVNVFQMPLLVCSMQYQGTIKDSAYKHIQTDIDDWFENPEINTLYKSFLAYIAEIHQNDIALVSAIRLVGKHGKSLIMNTFNVAKSHERTKCNLTLATTHSCKGLEFDEVIFAEDMNKSVEDVVAAKEANPDQVMSSDEVEAMNLYYVGASRAKLSLVNARYL